MSEIERTEIETRAEAMDAEEQKVFIRHMPFEVILDELHTRLGAFNEAVDAVEKIVKAVGEFKG